MSKVFFVGIVLLIVVIVINIILDVAIKKSGKKQ
jgi:ABC-type phosphate transport system permease subunit